MHALPRNIISYLCGKIFKVKFPSPFYLLFNYLFVWLYKIDMSEAEKPLFSYKSINELFTRKILMSKRIPESSYCSPCDGILQVSQAVEIDNTAIQAKGLSYSVSDLLSLDDDDNLDNFLPGWYTTVYLAPSNYHRVHSPVAGEVLSIKHIPGDLWPVNSYFVNRLPGLFIKNERLIFKIRENSGYLVYVVMVGALNVGQMTTHFVDNFATNNLRKKLYKRSFNIEKDKTISVGDELGVFHFGSTAIVVFDENISNHEDFYKYNEKAQPIRLGQSLLN